jgi:nucleoside-diphosphate-sugar epimerase
MLRAMHILVTGAGGFLGSHAVERALAAGHRVRAADLGGAELPEGAEPFVLDVRDESQVVAACRDVDVVIHAAGVFDFGASPELLRAVNVEGARRIAEHAPRMVAISSTGVYGRGGLGVREDAPHRPRNAYERTKSEGELAAAEVCARRGVPMAALRPTLIYGPRGRYGLALVVAQLALRAERGLREAPLLRGGWTGHHVHVADVARAAVLLAETEDASGAYNVADERALSTSELMGAILDAVGIDPRPLRVPFRVAGAVARVPGLLDWALAKQNPNLERAWKRLVEEHDLVPALSPCLDEAWLAYTLADYSYDTKRLRALGFRPEHPYVREGIAETVRWYRKARWLPKRAT